MSSIFGMVSKKKHHMEQSQFSGIQVWNLAYGKESKKSVSQDELFIGCCKDIINKSLNTIDPVVFRDRKYYAIDALIYNREDLIEQNGLSNNVSDEELIISIIEKEGFNALEYVNGDFAGACYDFDKKELILFRDHMGIRPLFYYICNDYVVFSTDIRGITGLLEADIKIDEEWLFRRISGMVKSGLSKTEYKDVFCVLPGSFISFKISKENIVSSVNIYWEPGRKKIQLVSDVEYQKRLRELIVDAIAKRLKVIDGEVGAELSGGLDSSVIDILINRMGRKCTYVSWSESPEILPLVKNDERQIIKDICEQEGIECTYENAVIDENSILVSNIKEMGLCTDNHSIDALVFPTYFNTPSISNTSLVLQKKGINVVFTGHGGDEGVSHRPNPFEMFYYHEFYHYLRYMWSTTHGKKWRVIKTLKAIKKNISKSLGDLKTPLVEPINVTNLIKPEFKSKYDEKEMGGYYFGVDPKQYIKDGGSRNRLDNLSLQGAYCGVRYLIPYLDYRVIDFAVSIPRYQYLRGRYERYIFREAFKDIMPKSLYKLTSKAENSRSSKEHDPDWYDDFLHSKVRLIEKFDRKIWEKYLDFDKLFEFAQSRKTTQEEQQTEVFNCICLQNCLTAQAVLEKTREISRIQAERCVNTV